MPWVYAIWLSYSTDFQTNQFSDFFNQQNPEQAELSRGWKKFHRCKIQPLEAHFLIQLLKSQLNRSISELISHQKGLNKRLSNHSSERIRLMNINPLKEFHLYRLLKNPTFTPTNDAMADMKPIPPSNLLLPIQRRSPHGKLFFENETSAPTPKSYDCRHYLKSSHLNKNS